jgi:tRNA uridine 5-carboxymethylaminomethyl modification enzyme
MQTTRAFDVIVIGAGHAGCEAALAAARLGADTLLLTGHLDHVAQMSCNPCIGGIAKGQVVREIDALGGEMGLNADASAIQTRMLNRSRGPAVYSPRAQCDKALYSRRMKWVLERQPGLLLHQAQATRILTAGEAVCGVETEFGDRFACASLVVATGTFLNGRLHYGLLSFPGGRAGDPGAYPLAVSLRDDLGLELARLKTGTPVRLLGRSIDFSVMERQDSDPEPLPFSFRGPPVGPGPGPAAPRSRLPCYLIRSTAAAAEIVRRNLDRSPLYTGRIGGIGTRYCPSFEDKIVRFPHHDVHHVFLEPEGAETDEYYLNGMSTSLPVDVQRQLVRALPGLAAAEITRYAYAIEYDFVPPHQLGPSLALRRWPNLFLAGQINGTSGYEEAAGQGLLAGINAGRRLAGRPPVILRRDQAYIGVMIDDLVTKDLVEPYRLFTSRAEHRLRLRQDNADLRLTPLACDVGLLPESERRRIAELRHEIERTRAALAARPAPGHGTLWEQLRRPDVRLHDLRCPDAVSPRAAEQLEIEARYEGYTEREQAQAQALLDLERWPVPASFTYAGIASLRAEARAKLEKRRPHTLAQAARMDGVTPADIAVLQVHLRRAGVHPG